jgi:glutamine cyclotransferase
MRVLVVAVVTCLGGGCASAPAANESGVQDAVPAAIPVHGFEVVRAYPHDEKAFTQGLVYRDGYLYESTGLEGESTLRQVEIATGRVLRRHDLAREIFGEGLTLWRDTLVQITWKNRIAFVYDVGSLEAKSTFTYDGDGWGLTHDGTRLIMSDGRPLLRFIDPQSGRDTGVVQVSDDGRPVVDLNELEFVKGQVYANVWHTDRIAVIDPADGRVTAWIDLTGLRPPAARQQSEAVLNGIAYDAAGDRLFVTGKLWPSLYEIRLRPPVAAASGAAAPSR